METTTETRWIFQDIEDIRAKHFSGADWSNIGERKANCDKDLSEKVSPELYTRYQLWKCDIYIDAYNIALVVESVYGDKVSRNQIYNWLNEYKREDQYFTA